MTYCEKCSSRECDYVEVAGFIDYLKDIKGSEYQLIECPDKKESNFTCDMILSDNDRKDKIYCEIKKVKLGFGKGKKVKNISLGEANGQNTYAHLVSMAIDCLDDAKKKYLDNYIVTFSKSQIYNDEAKDFYSQVLHFLNEHSFDDSIKHVDFVYKRETSNVNIEFDRKSEDIRNKFGDKILFAYQTDKDNTIDAIFKKTTDIDELFNMLKKNANNTSEKKFPETDDCKILLNILRMPAGYDIFFNLKLHYVIGEIIHNSSDLKTAATENYLLYYCEDYYEIDYNDIDKRPKSLGRVLIIVPLKKGIISEPTMLTLDI